MCVDAFVMVSMHVSFLKAIDHNVNKVANQWLIVMFYVSYIHNCLFYKTYTEKNVHTHTVTPLNRTGTLLIYA